MPSPVATARVHIGRVVRNARLFRLFGDRSPDLNSGELLEHVARLFDLLKERRVEYVLAGGVAMLSYIEGRRFIVRAASRA